MTRTPEVAGSARRRRAAAGRRRRAGSRREDDSAARRGLSTARRLHRGEPVAFSGPARLALPRRVTYGRSKLRARIPRPDVHNPFTGRAYNPRGAGRLWRGKAGRVRAFWCAALIGAFRRRGRDPVPGRRPTAQAAGTPPAARRARPLRGMRRDRLRRWEGVRDAAAYGDDTALDADRRRRHRRPGAWFTAPAAAWRGLTVAWRGSTAPPIACARRAVRAGLAGGRRRRLNRSTGRAQTRPGGGRKRRPGQIRRRGAPRASSIRPWFWRARADRRAQHGRVRRRDVIRQAASTPPGRSAATDRGGCAPAPGPGATRLALRRRRRIFAAAAGGSDPAIARVPARSTWPATARRGRGARASGLQQPGRPAWALADDGGLLEASGLDAAALGVRRPPLRRVAAGRGRPPGARRRYNPRRGRLVLRGRRGRRTGQRSCATRPAPGHPPWGSTATGLRGLGGASAAAASGARPGPQRPLGPAGGLGLDAASWPGGRWGQPWATGSRPPPPPTSPASCAPPSPPTGGGVHPIAGLSPPRYFLAWLPRRHALRRGAGLEPPPSRAASGRLPPGAWSVAGIDERGGRPHLAEPLDGRARRAARASGGAARAGRRARRLNAPGGALRPYWTWDASRRPLSRRRLRLRAVPRAPLRTDPTRRSAPRRPRGGLRGEARRTRKPTSSTTRIVDDDTSQPAAAGLAAGADAVHIRPAGAVPPPPFGLAPAGVYREVGLDSGATRLAPGRTAAVTLRYRDADGDGYVDGSAVRAERLRAHSYHPAAGPG